MESIVVLGGGLAAASVVSELRERGYSGKLTLISDETDLPYERPPLSKGFLQGKEEPADFIVHDSTWYSEHGVALRLGVAGISIEAEQQRVLLADGDSVSYDHLVLATGSRASLGKEAPIAGYDLPGVHVLRTLNDAKSLREDITEGTQVAVVGSGWIGMEVAASARQSGARVTVYSPTDVPLSKVFGERFGNYLLELHQRHGVDVRTARVQGIERADGHLQVYSDAGSSRADVVILAMGAVPNLELAETAGLDVDGGVVVDQSLRSSNRQILAVGDIAQAFNTHLDRHLRVEHWDNAIRQGKLAAATLTGADESSDWLPYFFTDQFDLGMEYVGHSSPDDTTVIRGDTESGEFIIFWQHGQTVTAAANVNIGDVNDTLRTLVGRNIDAERLADVQIDLTQL
ncbi:NAD(P)/FAD-dependent oxidoreductase [Glutamicibacter sp. M10]|uniref:NAD(P)/FAD-dependent oxidoreductase n=1 Tax=Glutamicibacter sp. M10 TaxID=3023076 RepID=UPI0021C822D1|nr:FAD-dependent oxidoreductase [Glutamicibacter sp. M10]UXN33008.1 FAD-dependent oxidoreductase [Glutamicibacter sp. M10]